MTPQTSQGQGRLSSVLLWLAPLSLGLIWYCHPGQNIGDACDNRFNMFILEHGYQWLTGRVPHFWDAAMFYPATENTVAMSVNHLGSLPIFALIRSVGLAREHAMTVWLAIVFALNYTSAAWVLKRLTGSQLGAAMGAWFFTFGMPVIGQAIHVQLFPRYFVPLALYFLIHAIRTHAWRPVILLVVAVVGQLYTDMYIGIFLLELLGFFCIANLLLPATRGNFLAWLLPRRPGPWLVRLALAIGAILVLLPMLLPYLHAFRAVGARTWPVVVSLLFTPVSLMLPPDHALAWQWLDGLGRFQHSNGEHRMFIGGTLFLLAAIYWRLRRQGRGLADETLLWTTLLAVLVAGILTARLSKSMSLYYLLYLLPGISSLRAITRIMLVLLLPLSLLLALFVQALEAHVATLPHRKLHALAGPALLLLLICDQAVTAFPHHTIGTDVDRVGAYTTAIQRHPSGFKAFALLGPNVVVNAVDALLVAQDTGVPTVNGYSGSFPSGWTFPERPEQIRAWLDACNRSGRFQTLTMNDIAILRER